MRVRDFVAKLKEKTKKLPSDTLGKDKLDTLLWVAAESELEVSKENLVPFIDILMAHGKDSNELCTILTNVLSPYIKTPQISPLLVWDWPSLLAAMSRYPVNQRIDALASLDIAKLSALILNGSDFRATVNNKENYIGDVAHARNTLMSLGYYYYELMRTRSDDYKHSSASWTGYDKAIKFKGINQILKFLESGRPLEEFETYLNSDRFSEIVASSIRKEYTLKDAVQQGELGELCKMITHVSKPENREPVQLASKSWFSWGQ